MAKCDTFVIKRIYLEHKNEVAALVKENYSGKNVIQKMLKFDPTEGAKLDISRSVHYLAFGTSVGAFETTSGRLVGVVLTVTKELGKQDNGTIEHIVDPNLKVIKRFVRSLEMDILQRLKANKLLFACIGAVQKDFENLGLGKELNLAALDVARLNNCDYFGGIVSTAFYPKKLGFEVAKEIKYADYVDDHMGIRLFKDCIIHPHTHAKIIVIPTKLTMQKANF